MTDLGMKGAKVMSKCKECGHFDVAAIPDALVKSDTEQLSDKMNYILKERGTRYGVWSEQATTAQGLKDRMGEAPNWNKLLPHQRESLEMIQHKISRILHGDPTLADSWLDIAGYATIGHTGGGS